MNVKAVVAFNKVLVSSSTYLKDDTISDRKPIQRLENENDIKVSFEDVFLEQ